MDDLENSAAVKERPENSAAKKKAFAIRLALVHRRLGITREDERRMRAEALTEGVHWAEIGNGIRYSTAGFDLLAEKIGAGASPVEAGETIAGLKVSEPPAAQKNGPGAKGEGSDRKVAGLLAERTGEAIGPAFLVRTLQCHFPNTHVVEVQVSVEESAARKCDGLTRGFMRVRSSENFLPGMLCWARVERGASNWTFLGRGDLPATETPIGPRSRGRW